jgi:hypothetical protein
MRYLFEVSSDIDDFDNCKWRYLSLLIPRSTQITNWFWDHITSNFSGSELRTLQTMVFRNIVENLNNGFQWGLVYKTLQILTPKMAKANLLLDEILMGNIDALPNLWGSCVHETKGQKSGSRYISLLRSLGVDFKRSIEAELGKLPGRILPNHRRMNILDQKILFYQNEEQDWILRWEWILDEEAPGYELLLEFPLMTVDRRGIQHDLPWPFFLPNGILSRDGRYQEGPEWDARLARRLAKTARKERARTGQKRPRSRMPGAWI